MPKPNLRAVNPEVPHARDIAAARVKAFRLDREKEKLSISNQVCTGAPKLFVDEVIARTERTIMEVPRARSRVNPYIALLLAFLSMAGIVWLFIQIG